MIHNIEVNVTKQQLTVTKAADIIKEYTISTAKNGIGQQYGSEKTPLGEHVIRAKIGGDQPANRVFIRRRPTGEIYSEALAQKNAPDRDWILTRILWLCGLEPGKNRFDNVDTMKRKIYIHGCPDKTILGVPSSRGCIKMHNHDIIELFDLVLAGTKVNIIEG